MGIFNGQNLPYLILNLPKLAQNFANAKWTYSKRPKFFLTLCHSGEISPNLVTQWEGKFFSHRRQFIFSFAENPHFRDLPNDSHYLKVPSLVSAFQAFQFPRIRPLSREEKKWNKMIRCLYLNPRSDYIDSAGTRAVYCN